MRKANYFRKTLETSVNISLNLDGKGESNINTGIGFLDHMLTLFSKHGSIDLDVQSEGDLHVDTHHSVEDIAIALGTCINTAINDKKGIKRYASTFTPMDEALILCVIDLSGRSYLKFDYQFKTERVGTFETETLQEFLYALSSNGKFCLHVNVMDGKNTHHIIEAIFKGLGRTIKEAVKIDPNDDSIPSTKGCL